MSKIIRNGASFAFGITLLEPPAVVTVVLGYLFGTFTLFASSFSSTSSAPGVGSSGPGTGN